jgi:hypothetical protein
MSEKLLRFFMLSDIKTVRLVCKHEACGAVVEIELNKVEHFCSNGCCKVCGQPFGVIDQRTSRWRDTNWLVAIAEAISVLQDGRTKVAVEIALPGECNGSA